MKKEAEVEAERLIELYSVLDLKTGSHRYFLSRQNARKCAFNCVEEMLKVIPMYTGTLNPKWELYTEVRKIIEQS